MAVYLTHHESRITNLRGAFPVAVGTRSSYRQVAVAQLEHAFARGRSVDNLIGKYARTTGPFAHVDGGKIYDTIMTYVARIYDNGE